MIFLSLVLVIVAAVALVLGVFQDGLGLIYVSIGTTVAAMAVLGVGVLTQRREERRAVTSPGYGDRPVRPTTTGTAAAPTQPVRSEEPAITLHDEAPAPAKKAVVRKVTATPAVEVAATGGDDRVSGTEEAASLAAQPEAAVAAAPVSRVARRKATAGKKATAKKATAKKAAAKKATAKKAAAKKATAKKATAKKAAAKKATAKKATAKKAAAKKATAKKATRRRLSPADLEAIKGLGPGKREALLRSFGSTSRVADASVEELSSVKGVSEDLAREIKKQLG